MTMTAALAELYSVPAHEVDRWPAQVRTVLHRNAIHRGWLTPDIEETP